jgi:hypothetical protein
MPVTEMATIPRAAVVVEDRYCNVFMLEHTRPGLRRRDARRAHRPLPDVPIAFCETRPLAEGLAYRFLGAGLAHAQAEATPRRG